MSRQVCACGSDHAGIAFATVEVCALIQSARAVAILDAWAVRFIEREWSSLINGHTEGRYDVPDGYVCLLRDLSGPITRAFAAATPHAARAAAAKAIKAGEV